MSRLTTLSITLQLFDKTELRNLHPQVHSKSLSPSLSILFLSPTPYQPPSTNHKSAPQHSSHNAESFQHKMQSVCIHSAPAPTFTRGINSPTMHKSITAHLMFPRRQGRLDSTHYRCSQSQRLAYPSLLRTTI